MDKEKVVEDFRELVDAAQILLGRMQSFYEEYKLAKDDLEELAKENKEFESLGGELGRILEEISI